MKKTLVLFALMVFATHSFAQKETTLQTPELLWKLGRVGLDAVSPDGAKAIYGVQRYDVAANKSSRTLFLVDISSGETRQITDNESTASDAEFHPSGQRIGYLKNGKLHVLAMDDGTVTGGKTTTASDIEMDGFHFSPDGKKILFIQSVKLDQKPAEQYPDLPLTTGRVSDGLMYRHWKTWHDYAYSHVFYADFINGKLSSTPVDLMPGEKFDSPLSPMGGIEQITWSHDGKYIAYTCRKLNGTAMAVSTNSDIYLYELATAKTANASEGLPGYDLEPAFSPDGRYLAWTSLERAGNEADRTRLMVQDLTTGIRTELTAGWQWECNHPQWAADSKKLYFLSANDFTYQVYQIETDTRKIKAVTKGRHDFTSLKVAGKNQVVCTRVAMDAPAEVYAVNTANGEMKRLSFATADVWDTVKKASVERRTVRTTDGKDMNVWLVLPPDFDPKKKYPALLYCQGGPQSALSQFFSYRWNLHLMASQGYVVIAPCRRGMPGGPEGQPWNDAISRDWGGQAMRDLLSATDAMRTEPFIDAERMGAVGASFGGYSVYWLAGNHNKRFKTFISHCGMFNNISWWGVTEELWFAKNDLGEDYWTNPNDPAWTTHSPHQFVKNWDTPIFVIHNELDFRVPLGEGLQAFQAAQMRGIPSRLLTFPDEGHWVIKAQNSLLWQREYFKWLDQWLK